MEKRVISTQMQDEDIKIEKNLRPLTHGRLYWSGES